MVFVLSSGSFSASIEKFLARFSMSSLTDDCGSNWTNSVVKFGLNAADVVEKLLCMDVDSSVNAAPFSRMAMVTDDNDAGDTDDDDAGDTDDDDYDDDDTDSTRVRARREGGAHGGARACTVR